MARRKWTGSRARAWWGRRQWTFLAAPMQGHSAEQPQQGL